MKPLILSLLFILLCSQGWAATYYARLDGGTATQCTGLSDAPYPGTGINQPCSYNHINWALSPSGNNPTKMVGGDTLIIDGSNGAQYMLGYGSPNSGDTSLCYYAWPWSCTLRSVPSGPDKDHPTRILGKGFDSGCNNPPQLWGNERVYSLLNLSGSNNVEIQCLELTDKDPCIEQADHVPGAACKRDAYPYGQWASQGIVASDSSNVLLKKVNIHGLGHTGIHAGRLKDWTLDHVQLVANGWVGWDGDIGTGGSSNSGTMIFDHVRIEFNGCGEKLDGTPWNCFGQSAGGYGDGLGTALTGGDWVFKYSNVSHNASDGIDLLYHDATGSVTVDHTKTEGNAGNQIKSSTNTIINAADVNGNCDYFSGNPIAYNVDACRAAGNAIALAFHAGMTATINGGTVNGNGDTLLLSSGDGCLGTEQIVATDVNFITGALQVGGGGDITKLYWPSGNNGEGGGPCGGVKLVQKTSGPACVPDGTCSAVTPACGQTTTGLDSCGASCSKAGDACPPPPTLTYITLSAFKSWLTTTTIQQADTTPIIKGIRVGKSPYKLYKVTIEKQ